MVTMREFRGHLQHVIDGGYTLCRLWDQLPASEQERLARAYPRALMDFDELLAMLDAWHGGLLEE